MRWLSITLLLITLPLAYASAQTHPALFPAPQQVVWGTGRFNLRANEPIHSDSRRAVFDLLNRLHRLTGSRHPLSQAARIRFVLLKSNDSQIGPEGYRLTINPASITVQANTARGLFYGSQTLLELVEKRGHRFQAPAVKIADWPAMAYRGVMLDISRGLVPNTATFKHFIRSLARMKFNYLQPYIEDTYAFKQYPFIGRDRGAWTPDEVRQFVKVARNYFIDLSPCFESLGHMYQILKHPEMAAMRETNDVISPAVPATYTFLNNCYQELTAAFPGRYLNVGCDETFGLGQGPSKALVAKEGVGKVYADHMFKLDKLCRRYHRVMQFWDDMMLRYPGIVGEMPKDAIVMNWDYWNTTHFPAIATYKSYGYQQIVCPSIQASGSIFPNLKQASPNIQGFIRAGKAADALGVLNTCWRDNGEVFFGYDWYPDAICAGSAWSTQPISGKAFNRGFDRNFFGPGGDDLAKAFTLLEDNVSVFAGGSPDQGFQFYYDDPFSNLWVAFSKTGVLALDHLLKVSGQVTDLVDQAHPAYHTEVLPYLRYGAERLAFIAKKYEMAADTARLYNQALQPNTSPQAQQSLVSQAIHQVKRMEIAADNLRNQYATLWLRENHMPGLPVVLNRYDPMVSAFQAMEGRLNAALSELKAGKPLPSAASIGLALPSTNESGYRIPVPLHSAPQWAKGKLAFRIQLPATLRSSLPARIVAPASSIGAGIPHVAALYLVGPSGKINDTIACQVDRVGKKSVYLTFILPSGANGTLHCVLSNRPAKVFNEVEIKPAHVLRGGWWIANSRFHALLGREGAHLYRWDVGALGGQDITMPGDTQWHGFDDVGAERESRFTLKPVMTGPICAQIKASAPDGFQKTLTFYAGLGWYETRFSQPVGFFWHYDDPAVMGSSSATPGRYRYANGQSGPLPPEGAMSIGAVSPWVAKYRPDGLTLGLISPKGNAMLRAGPGDGMGGVGVEGGGTTPYVETYADVNPGKWRAVADIYGSLESWIKAKIGYWPASPP